MKPDEHPEVEAPGSPVWGCLTSPVYTEIAHLRLIAEMLPADATIHLMTDPDGTFIAAEPIAFTELLKNNQADLTYVHFDKAQTTASKHKIMRAFRVHLQAFMDQCDPWWTLMQKRNAFIGAYASRSAPVASTPGDWWHSPIETMYEPMKRVGIAHQRRMSDETKRIDRWCELPANSSLHAVDSYFNVLRQRSHTCTGRGSRAQARTGTTHSRPTGRP